MGRAKIKMELIPKEKSRYSTYLKRKKGLMKKAYEFSTLCGVDVCVIIYGPKQGDHPIEPETYPNNQDQVHKVITQYLSTSKDGHTKRNYGLRDYFGELHKKMEEDVLKTRTNKSHSKLLTRDDWLKDFDLDQFQELIDNLNSKIETIDSRIDLMKGMPRRIEYSHAPGNQNLSLNMLSTFGDLGPTWPPRENHTVYQQQLQPVCFTTLMAHRTMNIYPSDPALFYDNEPRHTMLNPTMGTGFHNFDHYSGGAIGSSPFQMVRNPSLPCDPSVRMMPSEDIDVPNLGGGQYICPMQPKPSYLQYLSQGSSSSSHVMHHPHHYQQPTEEWLNFINTRYMKDKFK